MKMNKRKKLLSRICSVTIAASLTAASLAYVSYTSQEVYSEETSETAASAQEADASVTSAEGGVDSSPEETSLAAQDEESEETTEETTESSSETEEQSEEETTLASAKKTAAASVSDSSVCTFDGEGYDSLADAVSAVLATDSKTGTITIIADCTASSSISITSGADITITDDGEEHTLSKATTSILFDINSGGSLTIDAENLTVLATTKSSNGYSYAIVYCLGTFNLKAGTLDFNNITPYKSSSKGAWACVFVGGDDAVFTMDGGTIQNVKLSNQCAGVKVCSDGTFIMNGGTIKNCISSSCNTETAAVLAVSATSTSSSTKVYAEKGNGGATFKMTGGTITGNQAYQAGAVLLYSSAYYYRVNMEMSGGSITGNTAIGGYNTTALLGSGGGVTVYGNSAFTMSGGEISGNSVTGMGGGVAVVCGWESNETTWTNAYGDSAFELFCYYYPASFTMTGGTISGNSANCLSGYDLDSGSDGGEGGGIYVASNNVSISGGSITDNTAEDCGGGIYLGTIPYVLTLYNTLITENEASVLGGGIWSCATGNVEVYTSEGGAVYSNSAGAAGDDIASLAKDDEESYTLALSSHMLGGGAAAWYEDGAIDTSENESYGEADESVERYSASSGTTQITSVNTALSYALINDADEEYTQLAEDAAQLIISGNSAEYGGGIGTNGSVVIGTDEDSTQVTVQKSWEGDTENIRPESVTVSLSMDGTKVDCVELNEENEWTYTFTDLLAESDGEDCVYTIEEETDENYTAEYEISGDAENGYYITLTNTRKTGGFSLEKTISGATDSGTGFEFLITLEDSLISGTYGDLVFEDGTASVTLLAGESVNCTDLPAGISYTIKELSAADYEVSATAAGEALELEDGEAALSVIADTYIKISYDNYTEPEETATTSATEETEEETTAAQSDEDNPYTGQEFLLAFWIILIAAAAFAGILAAARLKRSRR